MGNSECFVEHCRNCICFDDVDNIIINNERIKAKLETAKTNENYGGDESQSSESSSAADVIITIEFNGNIYEFLVKEKYDLSKVLYKFKKSYKNLRPKGKFIFNNKEIDDLSKTCGELKIRDGEYLILQ